MLLPIVRRYAGLGLLALTIACDRDPVEPTLPVLGFLTQPTTTEVGATIAPAVRVEIRDAEGERLDEGAVAITLTLAENPGGDTLGGTVTVTSAEGIATFDDLTLDAVATGYTLRAAASDLAPVISTPFDVIAATPTALAFLTEPTTVAEGAAITPAVQVDVRDARGNRVIDAVVPVTLALAANPGGATLEGTLTVTSNGVATFDRLTLDAVATGYTLRATSPDLPPPSVPRSTWSPAHRRRWSSSHNPPTWWRVS